MQEAGSADSRIREIENIWIPMRDGTRLAGRVWMPADAAENPVPAILELIPYRKRDSTTRRDEMMHPWFAANGYAAIRVDLRGSGDSEGILADEYIALEQDDGCDIIAWLASQAWCSGTVGMIGLSWGGFNGLQIAARRPAALKAIVTVGSTDDRYADDIHFMGGAQLSSNFTWAQTFLSDLTRPPDPEIVGPDWRSQWLRRLENQTFLIGRWLSHPDRDEYWRHGSVCENYDAIECAVLAVGGWADSYTNAVPRLLRNLKAPCRAIIGPWAHDYPHTAVPGPQIGFLQECLRWWDHWLKGEESGALEAPPLRVYLQENLPADAGHQHRDGRWLAMEDYDASLPQVYHLSRGRLLTQLPASAQSEINTIASPQTLGWTAGEWCPYGASGDQPADQNVEDGLSLCFDTEPFVTSLEILGAPRIRLRLSSSSAQGMVVVRLNEVDAQGRSARVTYGVLDLEKRGGADRSIPMVPGDVVDVELSLCDTAYRFTPGRRIRIAISNTYWPTLWPSAEPVRLQLHADGSSLVLPLLDHDRVLDEPVRFQPAVRSEPASRTVVVAPSASRQLTRDFITGIETLEVRNDEGIERIDAHGLEFGRLCVERYSIHPDDPKSAVIEADWVTTTRRDGLNIVTKTSAEMRRTEAGFLVRCRVTALENDDTVFQREYVSGA